MRIQTVLAFTDLEEDSLTGLRGAFEIAERHDAKIVVGHVLVPRTLDPSNVKEFLDEHGFDSSAVTIDIEVDADVHSGIDLLVEDAHPDLIVLSSKRKRGLMRLLWASVPVGLVGHAKASVLSLHTGQEKFHFKRVLVAVDGSEQSQTLLDAAATMVDEGGEVVAMMVIEDSPLVIGGLDVGNYSDEVLAKAGAAADKFLSGLRLSRTGIRLQTEHAVGNAVEEILAVQKKRRADLIVLGSGGVGGQARFFLGKVCESVTRYADVPTMVVPTADS